MPWYDVGNCLAARLIFTSVGDDKLANLHLEHDHNTFSGPAAIVTDARSSDEVRIKIPFSLQQYVGH